MKGKRQDPYTLVTDNVFRLSRAELQDVADMIAGLLEALADEEQAEQQDPDPGQDKDAKRRPRGHIEHKIINKCGPYAYLRYWSGGHLKSHYIGKVEQGNGGE